MSDAENNSAAELALQISEAQHAQVDPTDEGSDSPAIAPATREELILGKFKSQDDLISAYQELERNHTASRQAQRAAQVQQPVVPQSEAIFDNETTHGIRSIFKAELEQEKATDFARRHREELADPLLKGAVLVEIQEANARGEYMDQEAALANAKRALENRLAPKVEAATKEVTEEQRALARKREQAGAVGGTNMVNPQVDPETLTAEEYAAYHGLNRV